MKKRLYSYYFLEWTMPFDHFTVQVPNNNNNNSNNNFTKDMQLDYKKQGPEESTP